MFESDNELDDDYLNNVALITNERSSYDTLNDNSLRDNKVTTLKSNNNDNIIIKEEKKSPELLSSTSIGNCSTGNPFRKFVVKRKFPGPAGLTPAKDCKKVVYNSNEIINGDQSTIINALICSQRSSAMFESELWQTMWREHKHLLIGTYSLTEKYTINRIQRMAKLKILQIPFLAAVVEVVDTSSKRISNVNLTLKDMTGEIQAIMSQELYEKYSDHIKGESVLVLANFGLLSLLHNTKHFIVIKDENLLTIYDYDDDNVNQSVRKIVNLNANDWNKAINLAVNNQFDNRNVLNDNKQNYFKRKFMDIDDGYNEGVTGNNVTNDLSNSNKKNCSYDSPKDIISSSNDIFNTDCCNLDDIDMNF